MTDLVEEPAEVVDVRPGEDLDWVALERHLRRRLPRLDGDFSVRQFPHGSANLTYLVRFGEDALVVRRPPFGTIAAGCARHAARIHRAVAAARGVPPGPARRALLRRHRGHRRPLPGLGVPARRRGLGPRAQELELGADPGRRIGLAVVDALADLHLVDPAVRPRRPRPPRGLPRPAGARLEAPLGGGRHRGPGDRGQGGGAAGAAPSRVRPARVGAQRLQGRQLPVHPGPARRRSRRSSTGTWPRSATR